MDSDGDGKVDECEDRFPPEIVLRNAAMFRCDEDDTSKLCHNEEVFKSEKQARNFLEFNFALADDCSPSKNLELVIEKNPSSNCHNTMYTLTPVQNITSCEGRAPVGIGDLEIVFENPLRGNEREVILDVDDEGPVVECGFRAPSSAGINMIDGNTLYHYLNTNDSAFDSLDDANFFYEVTVRTQSLSFIGKRRMIKKSGWNQCLIS